MQAKLFFQIFCFAFLASLSMMTLVKSTPLPNGGGVTTHTAHPAARPAARTHVAEANLPTYDAHRAAGNLHKNGGRAFKGIEQDALALGDHESAATLKAGRKMAGRKAAKEYSQASKLVAPVA